MVVIVGKITHAILHTYALKIALCTDGVIDFHTTIEVEDMLLIEDIIVTCCCTEVPAVHAVLGLIIETTLR